MNKVQTQVLSTPAGLVIRLGEVSDPARAWKRAEKKHGVKFVGFNNGNGAAAGSAATCKHFKRTAQFNAAVSGWHQSDRARAIQSRAAKALKLKLAAAGQDVRGLGAFEAFKLFAGSLPAGAGKLRNMASAFRSFCPARPLPLP